MLRTIIRTTTPFANAQPSLKRLSVLDEGRNFPEALALYCPRAGKSPYVVEQRVPTDEKQWAHVGETLIP